MLTSNRAWRLLTIALVLILVGGTLGWWIQTGAGVARVEEVRFPGIYNGYYVGYLWIPDGVDQDHPAPAILAAHGYNNSKEYMANTAIELARRGYVVLSIDWDKHGLSGVSTAPSGFGVVSPNGAGVFDGFRFLQSLPIVDTDNLGMIGMSAGGSHVEETASMVPGEYKALFFMDSGCDAFCEQLRNFAISVAKTTETPPNFGAINGAEIPNMARAIEVFGSNGPVEPGKIYGSIEDGTGKVFYQHWGDHPLSTDDPVSIGHAVDWFGMTIDGGSSLPGSNQIWQYKLVGTATVFIGMVLLLVAVGALLLDTPYFAVLKDKLPAYKGNTGAMWWVFAVITAFLGPVTLLWAFMIGFNGNFFHLVPIATGFTSWLAIVGALTLVILLAGYYIWGKKGGVTGESYGLLWGKSLDWSKIGKSALLALIVAVIGYITLAAVLAVFKVDARFWILTWKTTDFKRIAMMIPYTIPLFLYFVTLAIAWHGTLRPFKGEISLGKEILINTAILWLGVAIYLAYYYIPLTFFGGPSNFGPKGLGLINSIALLGLIPVLAYISTYFFRRTGKVYVGAFINTFFIAWYLVAANTVQGF